MTAPQPTARAGREDCRCVCGSLVARVVPGGVELKCRRCKRTLVVALEGGGAMSRAGAVRVPAVRDVG